MLPERAKEIAIVMSAMAEAEEAVAELYQVFAAKDAAESPFWTGLVSQEHGHANNMRSMAKLLESRPTAFLPGRQFSTVAINTFIRGVRENIQRARGDQISARSALFIARDIESSILENKVYEIVKTDDPEFLALIRGVISQTEEHNRAMKQKIAQLATPSPPV